MSISDKLTKLSTDISSAYSAVNTKGGTIPTDKNTDNLATAINSIPSGGGGAVEEKDVNFYDYDGTLLYSYTKNEFLALTELPTNPTHTGLVAQGWNWDLSDAKDYVTDYGILDIGQTYTTSSGLSEFDIELTTVTGLSVTLNMNGTKNWGDGTTNTATSHTYSTAGKYTITCDGTINTLSSGTGLFGQTQSSSKINYYVKNIRINNINTANSIFMECRSLKTVILLKSNNQVTLGNSIFSNCYILKNLVIPSNIIGLGEYFTSGCYCLQNCILPSSINTLGSTTFNQNFLLKKCFLPKNITSINGFNTFNKNYASEIRIIPQGITTIISNMFNENYLLTKIIFPNTITTLSSSSFSNCYNIKIYDFSKVLSIPVMDATSVFSGINKLAKIIVPDSLYEDWIAASNWTTYADYIIKESDYNAS